MDVSAFGISMIISDWTRRQETPSYWVFHFQQGCFADMLQASFLIALTVFGAMD